MLASPGLQDDPTVEIVEFAPAKINLALHVVGQRPDGYHLLESVVTFANIGDSVSFAASEEDRFSVSGPFSGTLAGYLDNNLVVEARNRLRQKLSAEGLAAPPVAIHLEKHLPVASGIGGGSADAAASLRGLLRYWRLEKAGMDLAELALSLGADVPMCLGSRPALVGGVGEKLQPLPDLPSLALLLGNPLVAVSTPAVFSRLHNKQNPPIRTIGNSDWIGRLCQLRNDLETPARELAKEIGDVCDLIASQGASLTRMSGSGATCFGIFASLAQAEQAAERLHALKPEWYFRATTTIAGSVA
jgi:4-diphosphocytidyl-2-C-methyl-D-erythritol kinase